MIAILMLVSGAVLVQFQELSQASAPSATAAAATPGSIYWACGLVLFSSFISALPNVAYEKKLKTEGENQWVNNVQASDASTSTSTTASRTAHLYRHHHHLSLLPRHLLSPAPQVTAWITLWVSLNALVPYIRPALGGLVSGGASPSALLPLLASLPSSLVQAFSGFTLSVWGVVMLKALNGILIPATFKYADNLIYSYARPSSIVVTCLFGAVMARAVPPLTMLAGVAIVVTSIGLYNSKPAEKTA